MAGVRIESPAFIFSATGLEIEALTISAVGIVLPGWGIAVEGESGAAEPGEAVFGVVLEKWQLRAVANRVRIRSVLL